MRATWLTVPIAALLAVGGCGGDDDPGPEPPVGDAIELTKWLPKGANSYASMDVSEFKDRFGVPGDADPLADRQLSLQASSASLSVALFLSGPATDVLDALDLPEVTAMASYSPPRPMPDPITVLAGPDVDLVRGELEDLGFVERDGVLEGPDGRRAVGLDEGNLRPNEQHPVAVRIEDDLIFVSTNAEALRSVRSEPADFPMEVQRELHGDLTDALFPYRCVRSWGYEMNADGSGAFVFLVDGGAEAENFDDGGDEAFGAPEVDGDQLRVPFELESSETPWGLLSETFAAYECG